MQPQSSRPWQPLSVVQCRAVNTMHHNMVQLAMPIIGYAHVDGVRVVCVRACVIEPLYVLCRRRPLLGLHSSRLQLPLQEQHPHPPTLALVLVSASMIQT